MSSMPNDQLMEPEMADSDGSLGAYGQTALNGGKNIDPAFNGATFSSLPELNDAIYV